MNEVNLVENYFRIKYPEKGIKIKTYYIIKDIFGVKENNLYIIEFIDTQIKHPKTLELQVKSNELCGK